MPAPINAPITPPVAAPAPAPASAAAIGPAITKFNPGSTIVLPGLNLIIAGPIVAALAGAGAGAATGGVIGALIGAGIPEYRAKVYEAGLLSGGILLGVETKSDEEGDKLEELLGALGGEHVRAE